MRAALLIGENSLRGFWIAACVLIIASVLLGARLESINKQLERGDPSLSIIAIELADAKQAREVAGKWADIHSVVYASLAYDVPFIIAYSASFLLLCSLAYATLHKRWTGWAELGAILGWLAIVAGTLDFMEDAAIFSIIAYQQFALATLCRLYALSKFVLIGILSGYLVATFFAATASRVFRLVHR